jgi:hypothetical protein
MKFIFALCVGFTLASSVIPARAEEDSSKYCHYECQYIDGQKVCANVCH